MIYDKIENIGRYLGISEYLDQAIRYIMTGNYRKAKYGKNIVFGEHIYYNCPEGAMAKNIEGMDYEYHRTYIDIHIPLQGKENIAFFSMETGKEVKAYDQENDYGLYSGKAEGKLCIEEGEFLMLFPEEVHLALMKVEEEVTPIEKVIFKVRAK
ncbi:YhcH/YjgK/YiaL family protein [Fusobacterium necrophorum]|uniref:YhcH/YjgK/YiaL family protein n=1 Tax=Fusobacterium necrophorum BL TaxID=1441732 RepID=A0AB73BWB0_9FUSO|nr:YhcH/YjgK/YiaL family protein [Fusobacterium necrophorum]EHO18294.1 hypothetical protein HMPREF9466_02251 [Fusobacterium necrophorum subsp. funduliforme 1_1_36S]AVQ21841.1 YhcH/YjgK/YiaL family protein [Fusobacterium necrophorum subsp. funduliforme]AYZ74082.1 DUF386 family protein [Fusobacterium necrophorum]AZW10039.1 DUF386 family protein [Fusobacterium necrophorum subsp. necrophorum]EYD68662.1 cytoplasmic protein [Fusobacterium necrophorum subsp. funduliforme B35]